jgi:exosome complex RNA-binding protein Rrp4
LLLRISIDKFYEIVTGDKNAFLNLCKVLPRMISQVVEENSDILSEEDTVIIELKKRNENLLEELYKMTYSDFWK